MLQATHCLLLLFLAVESGFYVTESSDFVEEVLTFLINSQKRSFLFCITEDNIIKVSSKQFNIVEDNIIKCTQPCHFLYANSVLHFVGAADVEVREASAVAGGKGGIR